MTSQPPPQPQPPPNKNEHAANQLLVAAAEKEAALRRMTTRAALSAITHSTPTPTPTTTDGKQQQQYKQQRRDPIYIYSSLVAGIGSGAVSAVVCAPLDLVRTRLQVWGDVVVVAGSSSGSTTSGTSSSSNSSRQAVMGMFRDIVQRDGIKGCFRGLTATLLTVPFFWGVYCEYRYTA